MSVAAPMTLNAFPAKLKPPAPSCVNEPSKLNPCPIVCYVLVLTKEQGKGKWGLPKKNLAKALDDYLAKGRMFGTPFFKTNPEEPINPVYLPQTTPEQHKECVNQQNTDCLFQLLPNTFILQLWRNIPLTTMTSIELRLLNTCCITQKVRC